MTNYPILRREAAVLRPNHPAHKAAMSALPKGVSIVWAFPESNRPNHIKAALDEAGLKTDLATTIGDTNGGQYIAQVCFNDTAIAEFLFEYAGEEEEPADNMRLLGANITEDDNCAYALGRMFDHITHTAKKTAEGRSLAIRDFCDAMI